jgi:hypothetical protein
MSMPVQSIKNQYLGINAHLHSYWQARGGWPEFHTGYILNLFYALKPLLLPLGYTALVEPSLQIRRIDTDTADYPESDLTIYDIDPNRPSKPLPVPLSATAGELVFPIVETILTTPVSQKQYNAIKIYETYSKRGSPVAWIELLSPSNKPGGRDVSDYFLKREKIIENSILFIEVDFLHESPPTLPGLPSYYARRGQPQMNFPPHPYTILVVDPRPTPMEGTVRVIGFDVDIPIPNIKLALNAGDELTIDLDRPYHKTIEDALYGLEFVDYSQFPERFERYRETDQTRIAARMLSVLQAAKAGVDLESGTFFVENLSLNEALAQIEIFKSS